MSIWVLGTDTDVGKTVVSALILHRYAPSGPIAYWKPVSTGGTGEGDSHTLRAWLPPQIPVLDEVYALPTPVSPHLAARLAGARIQPETILARLVGHALEDRQRNLVIEAAGGVLVPLSDAGDLYIETVAESALPVVVVSRSTLGTINHTLLTLEALRSRRIDVLGVILNGPPDRENRKAIESFGRVRAIAEVPPLGPRGDRRATLARRDIERAASHFDSAGLLREVLGPGGGRIAPGGDQ